MNLGETIPWGFIQSDRRERSRCLISRPRMNNPAPQLDHGSPCLMAIESKGFGDCCVLVNPREGRKHTTNPGYEFYAKYHAQITGDSYDTQADAIESRIAVSGAHSLECDCIRVATDPTQSARDTTSFVIESCLRSRRILSQSCPSRCARVNP